MVCWGIESMAEMGGAKLLEQGSFQMSSCSLGWAEAWLTTPCLERGHICCEAHCKLGLLSGRGLTLASLSWLRPFTHAALSRNLRELERNYKLSCVSHTTIWH